MRCGETRAGAGETTSAIMVTARPLSCSSEECPTGPVTGQYGFGGVPIEGFTSSSGKRRWQRQSEGVLCLQRQLNRAQNLPQKITPYLRFQTFSCLRNRGGKLWQHSKTSNGQVTIFLGNIQQTESHRSGMMRLIELLCVDPEKKKQTPDRIPCLAQMCAQYVPILLGSTGVEIIKSERRVRVKRTIKREPRRNSDSRTAMIGRASKTGRGAFGKSVRKEALRHSGKWMDCKKP